ncbi:MAG: hypothetical protein RI556_06660 [Hydrogenovibrio sp.]|uniref:hypothetical protein n=1 Tax=Hydrogenovibrio sp. TaxID=2065821 RepID=UPI0028703E34|nr:hypothetical protein [Hydrogenovibrio sp.]MDR9498839.1 hypothetical protein [Hydrogenovibrio sp.]
MTKNEKKEYLREHFLDDAVQSLKSVGRYWHGSISRTMTNAFCSLLNDKGYDVIVRKIPPEWEHVFYLSEDSSSEYSNKLEKIANKRSEQKDAGVNEKSLER